MNDEDNTVHDVLGVSLYNISATTAIGLPFIVAKCSFRKDDAFGTSLRHLRKVHVASVSKVKARTL